MYLLIVYVPKDQAETLKKSLFDFGCGRLGLYDSCAWSCEGTGQFRPQAGSTPTIGSQNKLEKVAESRIEMIYDGNDLDGLKKTLRDNHPYEEAAFAVLETK